MHLATTIRTRRGSRDPVLCEALVPDDAAICHACGHPAPRVRLWKAIESYHRDPHQGGNVETTVGRMRGAPDRCG